ncbi:MAG TPA: hypothetical protein VMR06_01585 [Dokdonella sp.]|uniref:hypothetical protein n=1 Tax=Dokdonella sp. TaxID=2291710 RepID=UPI002C5F418E|nr:hypothetical protein [Dokdonella sp.]HUD40668.1 hypothetical protein [Dokdonella sp.]
MIRAAGPTHSGEETGIVRHRADLRTAPARGWFLWSSMAIASGDGGSEIPRDCAADTGCGRAGGPRVGIPHRDGRFRESAVIRRDHVSTKDAAHRGGTGETIAKGAAVEAIESA